MGGPLKWTEDDREQMIAWANEQTDRCPAGHYLWQWDQKGDGPYVEQLVKCHACHRLQRRLADNRNVSDPSQFAGRFTRLVTPERLEETEMRDGDS